MAVGEGNVRSEVKHHIQSSGLEGTMWISRVGRFDLDENPTVYLQYSRVIYSCTLHGVMWGSER
jgi:hypothetical protein